MRSGTSFELDGDLIVIEATIAGPKGHSVVRLVLDTGASLTTLAPEIAEATGYTRAMRVAKSVVRSAVAEEHGYIVCPSQVRPAERRILVERIAGKLRLWPEPLMRCQMLQGCGQPGSSWCGGAGDVRGGPGTA